MTPPEVHAFPWEFERRIASASFVTDRIGEDGLNLQFADAVVHLDLPTSLMRVEQRIGRLDRIGRGMRQHTGGSVRSASPFRSTG